MPFDREKFLFRMLAAIFVVEAVFLSVGFYKCTQLSPDDYVKVCPKLGSRSEALFGVAIATTLSLIGGSANPFR